MTKRELVFLVLNRIKTGDKVNMGQYHYRDAEAAVAKFRSSYLKKVPENELDFYAKEYTASIETNATTGRKYVALTVQIEDLPRTAKGVVSLSTLKGQDSQFFPSTERKMKRFDNLEVTIVSERVGYIVRYDKIDFFPTMGDTASVRIMAIPTFDEYSDTENVPLGLNEMEIVVGARDYLLQTVPNE